MKLRRHRKRQSAVMAHSYRDEPYRTHWQITGRCSSGRDYCHGCINCEAWMFRERTGRFPSFEEAAAAADESNRLSLWTDQPKETT